MDNRKPQSEDARVPSDPPRPRSPQNKILILAAWPPELQALASFLKQDRTGLRNHVATETVGVGLVQAGVGAASVFAELAPSAVVLVGTAGVLPGHRWTPPQALAVDVVSLGLGDPPAVAEFPGPMLARLETSARLTGAIVKAARLERTGVVCPLGITRSLARARRLSEQTAATLENLEAFAVVHAAQRLRVPVAVVLGVANQVGPRGGAQWRANGDSAAEQACLAVTTWLQSAKSRAWTGQGVSPKTRGR